MTEFRGALRALLATPLVSLVAILSLGLGIGANTAIFSIVDALILRALPVPNAERLAVVGEINGRTSWTNPIWEAIRERPTLFDGAFAAARTRFNAAARGETDPIDGYFASAHYFDVLGVVMQRGRAFTDADDRRGGGPDGPVAVISHAYWQRRFGGADSVLGQSITLSQVNYTIVGVTPPSFFGHEVGRTFDVAVPLGTEPLVRGTESALDRRSSWWLDIMVRLRPGQNDAQATSLLRAVQPQIREETMPQDWRPADAVRFLSDPLTIRPASAGISSLRGRYERPLWALAAVVGFTLLIACGNIANLMLARAAARRHEFAVRTALGAPWWRIARQLLGENLLLSAIGAALGVLIALWGSQLLLGQIGTATNRVFLDIGLDWRMLGFTALIAIGTTLLFGIAPAVLASRVPPMDAIKQFASGRGGSGRKVSLSGVLVMTQVALSLVLLVGAGLFVRTFSSLADVDLGFSPQQTLIATVNAQRTDVPTDGRGALYDRVRAAAQAVPSVSNAAYSVLVPVSGSRWNTRLDFPGQTSLTDRERTVDLNYLSPGWFETMGTPIITGRDFDARDREGSTTTALVNRAFAEKYYGGRNPIGQIVVEPAFGVEDQATTIEIIGLVGDAVYSNLREEPPPTMYRAMAQMGDMPSSVVLTVRTSTANPSLVSRSLTTALSEVHPDLALTYRPMSQYIDASLSQERLIAMVSGFFGVLALLLAALGLYGVTAYAVSRRQIEMGIRMALGATPTSVVRLVMTRTGALVLGGIVLGGLGSWWASRFVGSLLFGLAPTDPTTIVGSMLLLSLVAFIAGGIPARRAARVDPALVMREG